MSQQQSIDGVQFAREGQRLRGNFPVERLSRIVDELFERTGDVSFVLAGHVDRNGKPAIDVEVRALLYLVCQRCLCRLEFKLERHSRLLLAVPGQVLPSIDSETTDAETVPAESVANILDVVEQEVLLGVPFAPAHQEGKCVLPARQLDRQIESPFSALAQLKASHAPNGC